jgi:hypothetical protein
MQQLDLVEKKQQHHTRTPLYLSSSPSKCTGTSTTTLPLLLPLRRERAWFILPVRSSTRCTRRRRLFVSHTPRRLCRPERTRSVFPIRRSASSTRCRRLIVPLAARLSIPPTKPLPLRRRRIWPSPSRTTAEHALPRRRRQRASAR